MKTCNFCKKSGHIKNFVETRGSLNITIARSMDIYRSFVG